MDKDTVETARETESVTTLLAAVATAQEDLPISTDGDIDVADANVVRADITAANGVMHVIHGALLPAAA